MLKLFTPQQIRACDSFTIQENSIKSIDLMERACHAFTRWFTEHFDITQRLGIVCGTGNNGGDGAGIERMLKEFGYDVQVWVIYGTAPVTEDFKINNERLKKSQVIVNNINDEASPLSFIEVDVLIDALFGSGLSRPATGIYAHVINAINRTEVFRVAVDVPSGLFIDAPSTGVVVEAHATVSFQFPKLSFMFPQYHKFVGTWHIVDIGLSKKFIEEEETDYFFVKRKHVCSLIKRRNKFDHKGTFGHALMLAGSFGKIGAAVLASRAALRSGLGLLTVHAPTCGYNILQSVVPEAMFSDEHNEKHISNLPDLNRFDTIGIGPGLGQHSETFEVFNSLFKIYKKPVVIDADGLNILSQNPALLQAIPAGSILTPHPKEFERLVGAWDDDFQRLSKQQQLARELASVIVLKGAYTSIACPSGKVYFNSTGNPGMATGGTGDVLTGILTGLLAQKYSAVDAAILGVFIHGWAGDVSAREKGQESLIASDLIEFIPDAFKTIQIICYNF